MESKVNYTIVGLFVIVLSVASVFVIFLFSGRYSKDYATYLVIMQEAGGLSLQAPVKFNGVEVGYVENISLNRNNPQQVILKLQIEEDIPITTSTYAILTAQGITGVSYVGLKAKTPAAPLLETKPGQPYPVIPAESSLFEDLENSLRQVSEDIASVSDSLSHMFDDNSTAAVQDTFLNLQAFTEALASSAPDLDASIRNASVTLANLAKASDAFPVAAQNLENSLRNIEGAVNSLESALEGVSQQAMPVTVELLQKIDTIAVSLEAFIAELERQPGVLIRGKKTLPPGPGE
ncbi:MAG: MCE family protein [Legionellales bacterium]|nr:MCE family protein [Legionellales bacterium]